MRVNFNTPISYKETVQAGKKTPNFSFAETYFKWSGHYYVTVKKIDGKQVVRLSPETYKLTTCQKIVRLLSYLTLIIPIIMIFARTISRASQKLEVEGSHGSGVIGRVKGKPNAHGEVSKFDEVTKGFQSGALRLKPKDLPIPIPKQDTEIGDLSAYAFSLGLQDDEEVMEGIENVTAIATGMRDETGQMINLYARAVIECFNDTDIQEDLKREVFINIGRGCGKGTCHPGILTKLQKEYGRLLGAGEHDVKEIVLREVADLKLETLNVIAREFYIEYLQNEYPGYGDKQIIEQMDKGSLQPHIIAAAQVRWERDWGLDGVAGRRDDNLPCGERFVGKQRFPQRFLECFTPESVVQHVLGKLNANKDKHGLALHIAEYNDFIKKNLLEEGYRKPDSIEALKKGPLSQYVGQLIKESPKLANDLNQLYEEALAEHIKTLYIDYNEDLCAPAFLTQAGIEYILSHIGILQK